MRVDIIGGGPAGLFLSILLRRENIAADVRLFERYPADRTYGWGVVFPEGALAELARVDPASHAAIVAAGTTWTPVEIRYKTTRRRVNGNSFHGIPRTALLSILRDAATAVGVQLHHDHAVTDLSAHAGADLLVGADGVNSVVRRAHEAAFGPRFEHSAYRYAWLGVDRVFHDFTYIFRDTEWGLFQGYCYPSGQPWSSMIIYVSAETWARSGLDTASEADAEALLERIFAADLDGRSITARGAPWANFPHLTCRRWHHRTGQQSIVLIGDAAHTAHWSIGSGTRLAVEDAIALAAELGTGSGTGSGTAAAAGGLPAALARYEQARRGKVERFQAAARRSERYFENLERYFHYEPIQFAYQLMARSWRITHDDIAKRDPQFAARFDGWFHSRATGEPTHLAPSPAFAPYRLGTLDIRNRVVTEDATPGSGLTLTRLASRPAPPTRPAPATHGRGAGVWAAITGPGPDETVPPAPSPAAAIRIPPGATASTAATAAAASAAGYAVAILDLAAESIADLRAHPPTAALAALRQAWPADRPLGIALGVGGPGHPAPAERAEPTERPAAGDDPAAAVELARVLAGAGAELVLLEPHPDAPPGTVVAKGIALGAAAGLVVQTADAVRNDANLPVIVSGTTQTLNEIDTVIAAGWADLCVLQPGANPADQQVPDSVGVHVADQVREEAWAQ